MSLLFETIRITNGSPQLLDYHNRRCNKSRKELLDLDISLDLREYIKVPPYFSDGLVKCKISYAACVTEIAFQSYHPRSIQKIKLVRSEGLTYLHKFSDRSSLSPFFDEKENCDEVLFINDGLVTDCFYYNVAFWDGANWISPEQCLLPGVMRANLLHQGIIQLGTITETDISTYQKICLFNALTPFDKIVLDVGTLLK